MANVLPNGIGGNVADQLITGVPLILSSPARIWYVDSQTGVAGNSGKDRKFPFERIEDALAAIGANPDHIIVCMNGHTQVGGPGLINNRVTIVGEGSTDGIPTVVLHGFEGECAPFFVVNADGVEFRNLRFAGVPDSEATHCGYISSSASRGGLVRGCVFDMGPGCTIEAGVRLGTGSDDWRFENCTWRAVSTTSPVISRPLQGFQVTAAISRLVLEDCVFDGGLHGFDDDSGNPYAFDSAAFVITPMRVLNMTLLNGADFKLHEDTPGYVNPESATGHAKVEW